MDNEIRLFREAVLDAFANLVSKLDGLGLGGQHAYTWPMTTMAGAASRLAQAFMIPTVDSIGSLRQYLHAFVLSHSRPKESTMTVEHQRRVLQAYLDWLKSKDFEPVEMNSDIFNDRDASLRHCAWMCQKMLQDNDREKADRWLGWVQGVLYAFGCFTVSEEREHSRPPEKGGKLP